LSLHGHGRRLDPPALDEGAPSDTERHPMQVGSPCPFCGKPLTLRKSSAPRSAGRAHFAYCATDKAAWELQPRREADVQMNAGDAPAQRFRA
jgi:hypothetical protein